MNKAGHERISLPQCAETKPTKSQHPPLVVEGKYRRPATLSHGCLMSDSGRHELIKYIQSKATPE
jgi:hypothetical protein